MKKELNLTQEILSKKAKALNIWNVSEKDCVYTESDVFEAYDDFLSVFGGYLDKIFMLDTDKANYKGTVDYLKNIIKSIESDESNGCKKIEDVFVKNPLNYKCENITEESNNNSTEECVEYDYIKHIQELIEEKMYLSYCIYQIIKRGIVIKDVIPDFGFNDINSFCPDIFGNDKKVIKLYEDILIKENKERFLKKLLSK